MSVQALSTPFRSLSAALIVAATVLTACGDDDAAEHDVSPITVEQLLERSADTAIAVQGFLIDKDGVTRLCAAILESFPPQCGEPAVQLVGLDLAIVVGTETNQGVTWKEAVVVTVQRRQDARFEALSVDSLSTE